MVSMKQVRQYLNKMYEEWAVDWPCIQNVSAWSQIYEDDGYDGKVARLDVDEWLQENIEAGGWSKHNAKWYGFKNEDDAFAFKMRFG